MKVFSILVLLLATCHRLTPDDKLKINNNTNQGVCFATAAYNFKDSLFRLSMNGYLKPGETMSPYIRVAIREKLEKQIPDSTLFILFFDCSSENYVNNNLSKAFKDSSISKIKLSKKNLDSLNWYVIFSGN